VTMLKYVTLVHQITSRLEKILAYKRYVILKTAKLVKILILKTKFVKDATKDSS